MSMFACCCSLKPGVSCAKGVGSTRTGDIISLSGAGCGRSAGGHNPPNLKGHLHEQLPMYGYVAFCLAVMTHAHVFAAWCIGLKCVLWNSNRCGHGMCQGVDSPVCRLVCWSVCGVSSVCMVQVLCHRECLVKVEVRSGR